MSLLCALSSGELKVGNGQCCVKLCEKNVAISVIRDVIYKPLRAQIVKVPVSYEIKHKNVMVGF